jgi:hypothetical protein
MPFERRVACAFDLLRRSVPETISLKGFTEPAFMVMMHHPPTPHRNEAVGDSRVTQVVYKVYRVS